MDVVTVLLVCLMPNCVGEYYLNVFQIKGGDATNENQSRRSRLLVLCNSLYLLFK